EFVMLADGQLVRKHVAQIELERAFRLLREGRVGDAEAACEVVALRHKARDPDVYKLAALARAYVRELAGNHDGARAALELLGAERRFATDTDRLLFLVYNYEKLGRPDDVRAAINVYRYLQRNFEALSIHARLARLLALAGDTRAA